jgi:hypothetical protein
MMTTTTLRNLIAIVFLATAFAASERATEATGYFDCGQVSCMLGGWGGEYSIECSWNSTYGSFGFETDCEEAREFWDSTCYSFGTVPPGDVSGWWCDEEGGVHSLGWVRCTWYGEVCS